jgi:hypothetical protein
MITRPIRRLGPMALLFTGIVVAGAGCGTSAPEPADADADIDATSGQSPPAYTRDKIIDPKLLEVARSFTGWVESQKAGGARVFLRVEILPPTPTLLPYGIGIYQKEPRLPAILITGPGWSALKPREREALAARAFQDLSNRLASAHSTPVPASVPAPALQPTITIQTPQGLELAWINQLEPGGIYLHGERE